MLSVMNRFFLIFFALLSTLATLSAAETERPTVLVSIAPHKFFVEQIAGDTLKLLVMVPAGASLHTYEPTPKQMLAASNAAIWFHMGETFETKAIAALKSHNPALILIDLRQGLQLIQGSCHHNHQNGDQQTPCHSHSMDLHFWLSARMAKQQAKTIADALIATYPQHTTLYQERLAHFIQELDALDADLTKELLPAAGHLIMVSHPAYGYFCRDYNLKQFSIEFEGKDPTPQQLTRILQQARTSQTTTIFAQPQYNNKGAQLIAREIGAKVVILDPYSEDYFNTMRSIGTHFAQSITRS